MQACLFCGGDATTPDHLLHCDGRQGQMEAFATNSTYRAPAILNAELGEQLREVAITRVERGAPEDFKDRVANAIWRLAHCCQEFTSDQVWLELGEEGQWHPERRVLGPIMLNAARQGLIVATDRFVLTAQAARHRAPIRVWRSLIHG